MSWLTKSFESDVVLNYRSNGKVVRKRVSRAQLAALVNEAFAEGKATVHDGCVAPATDRAGEQTYQEARRALLDLGMM